MSDTTSAERARREICDMIDVSPLNGRCETVWLNPTGRSAGNCPRRHRTAAMRALGTVLHRQETSFYFNELSDAVNEKISAPNPQAREHDCPKPRKRSMDRLLPQYV